MIGISIGIRRFTDRAIDNFLTKNVGKTINIVNITELIFYHIQNTPELMNFKVSHNDTYLKIVNSSSDNPDKDIGRHIKKIFQLENINEGNDSIISSLIDSYTSHIYDREYCNTTITIGIHNIKILNEFTIKIIN